MDLRSIRSEFHLFVLFQYVKVNTGILRVANLYAGDQNCTFGTVNAGVTANMSEPETSKPVPTRKQILDAAESAVLAKGFSGTSIDELIAAVGISKSGFFYHFRDKTELAKALLQRYVEDDNAIFDGIFARADDLSEDPLHSYLIGLKMLAEVFADLPNGHPGCMVASICYHEQLFDREVRQINADAVLGWRSRFRQRLDRIASKYPPRINIDLDDLADMVSVVADGGIILSKATGEKSELPRQMLLYRDFVRLIFSPEPNQGGIRPD